MQHIWHLLSARRSRFIIWCKGECDYGWKVNTYLRSMWQNGNYDTAGTDFHQQWNCNEIYTGPLFIAKMYGLTDKQALEELNEIKNDVESNWRRLAQQYGLRRSEIEEMAPAFNMEYKS